jgi:hypothetical protein
MIVRGGAWSCMAVRGNLRTGMHMHASHGCAGSCVGVRARARISTCMCALHMHVGLCGHFLMIAYIDDQVLNSCNLLIRLPSCALRPERAIH